MEFIEDKTSVLNYLQHLIYLEKKILLLGPESQFSE